MFGYPLNLGRSALRAASILCGVLILALLLSACAPSAAQPPAAQPAAPTTAPAGGTVPTTAPPAGAEATSAPTAAAGETTPTTAPAAGAASTAAPAAAAGGQAMTVDLKGFAFDPKTLTVSVGTTVTWTNQESTIHTVTADDGAFDSKDLAQGAKFSFTFSQPGTYPYFCKYHGGKGGQGMSGTITVK